MTYYKVIFGFAPEDSVCIDETELEKAIYAHVTGKKAIFNEGTVSGERIIAIQPDYHRAMGWNRGYKLGADDFAQLSQEGVDIRHRELYAATKQKVSYLISSKKEHLIGKNVDMPQLAASKDAGHLAANLRIT